MLRNARKSRGNAVSISLQILCAVSEAASDDASTYSSSSSDKSALKCIACRCRVRISSWR